VKLVVLNRIESNRMESFSILANRPSLVTSRNRRSMLKKKYNLTLR